MIGSRLEDILQHQINGSTSYMGRPLSRIEEQNIQILEQGGGGGGGVSDMIGATENADGSHGLAPQPHAGDQDKVLQGNGKWGKKLQMDVVIQNGEYGYINSNNQFVAFKSQADIDAAVSAAMVGTATAADVKEGVTFTNSTTSGLTGTFAPQEKTVTAGTSAASVTPDSGKYLTKVTVSPQAHSDTYTPTANSSASNMGATHNYRYVDTRTVYTLGLHTGGSIKQVSYAPKRTKRTLTVGNGNHVLVVCISAEGTMGSCAVTALTLVKDWTSYGSGTAEQPYVRVYEYTATSTSISVTPPASNPAFIIELNG